MPRSPVSDKACWDFLNKTLPVPLTPKMYNTTLRMKRLHELPQGYSPQFPVMSCAKIDACSRDLLIPFHDLYDWVKPPPPADGCVLDFSSPSHGNQSTKIPNCVCVCVCVCVCLVCVWCVCGVCA